MLVSVARALDLPGGVWVRLEAFTPPTTLLYVAAAVVLLLLWLRGRGGVAVRVLTVLALLGAVVHAYWSSGPFLGGSPAEAASRGHVAVMTSNLRFGQGDTARVVELVVAHHVDVLVLEEITPAALAGLRAAGLFRVLPHHAGRPAADTTKGTMVFSRDRLSHVRRL